MNNSLFQYCLRLGDTSLILGQRLGDWCGHGPILEEDIAMTNIALDMIGQARAFLTYAAEVEGKGKTEDDLAYRAVSVSISTCSSPNNPTVILP